MFTETWLNIAVDSQFIAARQQQWYRICWHFKATFFFWNCFLSNKLNYV